MDLELTGRVAIVTGGASGIGAAITARLAAEGAIAVIFGRSAQQASPLIRQCAARDQRVDFIEVELTDTDRCRFAIDEVADRHGGIDILVNNAGVNDSVSLDSPVGKFRESLEKNLVQVFACTHFSAPYLRRRRGAVVNIGSKVAETGQGNTSGYAASKGGMNALTREWALALADDGARCNAIVPAEVITPMYRRWLDSTVDDTEAAISRIGSLIPLGRRTTTADEIAAMAAFLASPVSGHTTGQIIYVDGGYTHLDRAFTSPPI